MKVQELFAQPQTVLLDGGMGTMLQAAGLAAGAKPELLNLTDPQLIQSIHAQYVAAGSRIINTNTFGASAKKLEGTGVTVEQVVAAAVANARAACAASGALVALDIGPLGELLEPAGTLTLEQAVAQFARVVRAGAAAGADLVFLETFTDLYELKAALLAVKEHCALPVLASMSFEPTGRTFTGCTVESFAATARGLGADAVGINCSLGPAAIHPLAVRLAAAVPAQYPIFVKPNAGLPRADGSGYDLTPTAFAYQMRAYRALGLFAAGGCCGTTPQFIAGLGAVFAGCVPGRPGAAAPGSVLCTPVRCVAVDGVTIVGERINPTGKKRLQQAIRDGNTDYILQQAVEQAEQGAQVLDVNVGVPGVDEPAALAAAVKAVQSVCDLPLMLDSTNPAALERALRVYNGKPIVNSVNGEQKVLDAILPLCKKYGAAVVGLTLDETGIPTQAADRVAIARRIRDAALAAGIPPQDIYIDCLTLTASAQQSAVMQTLAALRACKEQLGVRTVLGVSNVSYGLPCRPVLNTAFFTLAMGAGLDLAILNPASGEMMDAAAAFAVLTGRDERSERYIARCAARTPAAPAAAEAPQTTTLAAAVRRGLRSESAAAAATLLQTKAPLAVVDEELVPALDAVGKAYEAGTLFLPQLLQAAAAAQAAFEVLRRQMAAAGTAPQGKGSIVLATVKGDVHDIGKNIVKVILENYGFAVTDLGRDVPPQAVVDAVQRTGATLVGLSALMTTTLPAMADTIALLHARCPGVAVMVGGAVLTPEYAASIGADHYAKDAKQGADIAKAHFAR